MTSTFDANELAILAGIRKPVHHDPIPAMLAEEQRKKELLNETLVVGKRVSVANNMKTINENILADARAMGKVAQLLENDQLVTKFVAGDFDNKFTKLSTYFQKSIISPAQAYEYLRENVMGIEKELDIIIEAPELLALTGEEHFVVSPIECKVFENVTCTDESTDVGGIGTGAKLTKMKNVADTWFMTNRNIKKYVKLSESAIEVYIKSGLIVG